MAFERIGVGLLARDVEEMTDELGRLAHIHVGDRVGQPAFEPDDWPREARPEAGERAGAVERALGGREGGEPFRRLAAQHQRRVRERLRPAGQHEVGLAALDGAKRVVDGQHPRAAIDLHRPGGHRCTHAEAQCRDTRRVHLVCDHVDASEHHPVEGVRREGLAHEQRSAALNGKIDRREGPGLAARPQKGGARSVHDVDGPPAAPIGATPPRSRLAGRGLRRSGTGRPALCSRLGTPCARTRLGHYSAASLVT